MFKRADERHKIVKQIKRIISFLITLRTTFNVSFFHRLRSERELITFSKATHVAKKRRKVLVDGLWDNPNYWIRFALVRKALNLSNWSNWGLLGEHSRFSVKNTFKRFNFDGQIDFKKIVQKHQCRKTAINLLKNVNTPDDILKLQLPNAFPIQVFYDGVLKRQRRGTVEINDKNLISYLAEAIGYIKAAEEIIRNGRYNLILLSHALDFTYGALAWAALRNNIEVIVLYGDFGHQKFIRLSCKDDLFSYPERISVIELNQLSVKKKKRLEVIGEQQLSRRFLGETGDVGSHYAYKLRKEKIDRADIKKLFNHNNDKPTIGVYNSNWFDFPHCSGLTEFRDFKQWIDHTIGIAVQNEDVNWIFKAHPCDNWYGNMNGETLSDLIKSVDKPNIILANESWNGLALINSLDGIMTCHGTIGLEAVSKGVPVLTPYRGWYGHLGFTISAKSKANYMKLLKTEWWKNKPTSEMKSMAKIVSGLYFCIPSWGDGYSFNDDSEQNKIYLDLKNFLSKNETTLLMEVATIQRWLKSGEAYYHKFKMTDAKEYICCLREDR